MKLAIVTVTLFLTAPAAAQMLSLSPRPLVDWPVTMPWVDANEVNHGTATFSGDKVYLRDHAGALVATIVVNPDGTKSFYDPSGKIIDRKVK